MYCGALLTDAPATVHGMDAPQWIQEALRVAQLKQLERAVACLDNALQIEPSKYPAAWFDRGLLLAELGRLPEAVASFDQAIVLDPEFEQAVDVRARIRKDPRAVLPPGRPGQTMLEMLADGGPADAYAMSSSTLLFQKLNRFSGPEEIAAMNWIVAVPSGRGAAADAEVLFNVVVRDTTAYTFRHAGAAAELPDELVPQKELEAFGALLAGGILRSIAICASRAVTAATRARVEAINDGLSKLGIARHARVELLVIAEDE
jgi:tetratricopeptide (TPR) repeat protein